MNTPDPIRFALPVQPTEEDLQELAEVFNGDPVPAIRRALELWGRPAAPAAAPAVDGEAEKLAAWLEKTYEYANELGRPDWAQFSHRAAALLRQIGDTSPQRLRHCPTHGQQPAHAWGCPECVRELREQLGATAAAAPAVVAVAVSERLPEPGVKVLAYYLNELSNGRTVCAIWVPAKTRSDSYGDDDFTEYDEKTDTFYWPEGWYEAIENWDDLGYVKVDEGEVIYWQPLPQWPWAYAIAAELRGGADG